MLETWTRSLRELAIPPPLPYAVGLAISLFLLAAGGYSLVVFLRLVTIQRREEGRRVKWRELEVKVKLVGLLTLTSFVLGLYLETAALLESSGLSIPLGYTFYNYAEIPLGVGLLGLAYVLRLQSHMPSAKAGI